MVVAFWVLGWWMTRDRRSGRSGPSWRNWWSERGRLAITRKIGQWLDSQRCERWAIWNSFLALAKRGNRLDEPAVDGAVRVREVAGTLALEVRWTERKEGQCQLVHVREALDGVQMKSSDHGGLQPGRNARAKDVRCYVPTMEDGANEIVAFEIFERRPPSEEQVQEGGNAVLIAPISRILATEKLGRDVAGHTLNRPKLAYSGLVRLENRRIEREREAEAEDLYSFQPGRLVGDTDVTRLEVTVDDGTDVAGGNAAADC
jgi:hypothetical protein